MEINADEIHEDMKAKEEGKGEGERRAVRRQRRM